MIQKKPDFFKLIFGMSERRSAVLVNPSNSDLPDSVACGICDNYDSLFYCFLCKKITCYWCIRITKNADYCILCINDVTKHQYIFPTIRTELTRCERFTAFLGLTSRRKVQSITPL